MSTTIEFPAYQATDYDPRLAAHEAARDVLYTIQQHPDLTVEQGEILLQAYRVLKELANG